MGNVGLSTLPPNNPDQSSRTPFVVLIRRKGRIAFSDSETLCERFWHAVKSNKSQPNLTSTRRRVKRKSFRHSGPAVSGQTSSNRTSRARVEFQRHDSCKRGK